MPCFTPENLRIQGTMSILFDGGGTRWIEEFRKPDDKFAEP